MKFWSDSIEHGAALPTHYAFATFHADTHVELTDNKNPHFAWSELPEGTKSLALVCHDPDVPSSGEDVNQEGKAVPADLPRVDFYHWVLVNLAPDASPIAEGEFSDGVTARGKDGPDGPRGTRQGPNNYTQWFDGDADMAGDYFGYDGPCPPWNDTIVHHYHFTLYALSVAEYPADAALTGPEVVAAIAEHVLDKATIMATYTINPAAVDKTVDGVD